MQVTVDVVIFTIQQSVLKVLLVKRRIEPFIGQFAIPGGFVLEDEDLEQAGARECRIRFRQSGAGAPPDAVPPDAVPRPIAIAQAITTGSRCFTVPAAWGSRIARSTVSRRE